MLLNVNNDIEVSCFTVIWSHFSFAAQAKLVAFVYTRWNSHANFSSFPYDTCAMTVATRGLDECASSSAFGAGRYEAHIHTKGAFTDVFYLSCAVASWACYWIGSRSC